ncbi:uncharacterized protein LOC121059784 isoform X2 [Cygnus olor]|uniref:uncharacterized protein LOC121059784 isoform X2 n=1 Tax=Cygnus olor TaxID=8869 RepID=UPI001ADE9284|nr:uncharacterized protein LOC121059784 isoform X2 [Cygnus olor]
MSAFHREARRRQAALERRRTGPGAGGTRRAAPGPRSPPPPRLQATASLEGDPKHGPGTAVTQSPPPGSAVLAAMVRHDEPAGQKLTARISIRSGQAS